MLAQGNTQRDSLTAGTAHRRAECPPGFGPSAGFCKAAKKSPGRGGSGLSSLPDTAGSGPVGGGQGVAIPRYAHAEWKSIRRKSPARSRRRPRCAGRARWRRWKCRKDEWRCTGFCEARRRSRAALHRSGNSSTPIRWPIFAKPLFTVPLRGFIHHRFAQSGGSSSAG